MKTIWKMATVAAVSVAATAGVGALAYTASDTGQFGGLGRMGRMDANGDGAVTRAEWTAAADARFARLDVNRDGKLIAAELPRRGRHGGGRHGGHGEGRGDRARDPGGYWDGLPQPQPLPPQPATGNMAAPVTPAT